MSEGCESGTIAFATVLIPDYKVWLYRELSLAFPGCFVAIHGKERAGTVPRDYGPIGLDRELLVNNQYFTILGLDLVWIPMVRWLLHHRPSVVILQDGVRILSNYPVHLLCRAFGAKIFYYSHGFNHQASITRTSLVSRSVELVRRCLLQRSDGVLVYSAGGARYLAQRGLRTPLHVVRNTIDTAAATRRARAVSSDAVSQLRDKLGLGPATRIVVTIGRLVREKNIDLFIAVIQRLNEDLGVDCVGLVLGDGPLRAELERKAAGSRVTFVGHASGPALSLYLRASDVAFMPGMVGLAIVEIFCAGTAFVALNIPFHSPEIEYLNPGVNGLLLDTQDPRDIAGHLAELLADDALKQRLAREGERTAEQDLSGAAMIRVFVRAIREAGEHQ